MSTLHDFTVKIRVRPTLLDSEPPGQQLSQAAVVLQAVVPVVLWLVSPPLHASRPSIRRKVCGPSWQ